MDTILLLAHVDADGSLAKPAREALAAARSLKAALAGQVDVNLFISENTIRFETCDNGIGFDTAIVKPTSLGMRIMRERAEAIGADFQLTSQPGAGTCVEVTWNRNPNAKLKVM